MFGLIPKDEKFFVLFKELTGTIIEGAQLLKEMLDRFENPALSQRMIKDVEHKGMVEFRPRQEGNTLHLILAPKKDVPAPKVKPVAPPKPAPPAAQGGAQTA